MRRRRWFWILLFVLGIILLVFLALFYNWVLVQDHFNLLALAPKLAAGEQWVPRFPWLKVLIGTLGFSGALAGLILFFVRLVQEMGLNQKQSAFLAAVTHELKTPLATIELCGSLLQSGVSSDEAIKLWSAHRAELLRLKNQIDSLLEAARMQMELPVAEFQVVDLDRWLEAQWPIWSQRFPIQKSGTPFHCKARIDPRLMTLIFENLLDNAKKYSKGTPEVTVAFGTEGRSFWIQVRDHGWGFGPQVSKKIFERFFRAKTAVPYAIPGTGLGLFLALQAARTQGFSLAGTSQGEGKGAEFTLTGDIYETL